MADLDIAALRAPGGLLEQLDGPVSRALNERAKAALLAVLDELAVARRREEVAGGMIGEMKTSLQMHFDRVSELNGRVEQLQADCADAIEHAKIWQARGEKAEARISADAAEIGRLGELEQRFHNSLNEQILSDLERRAEAAEARADSLNAEIRRLNNVIAFRAAATCGLTLRVGAAEARAAELAKALRDTVSLIRGDIAGPAQRAGILAEADAALAATAPAQGEELISYPVGAARRAIEALRMPADSLARVPNTVRQAIADIIEELLAVHVAPPPDRATEALREALTPFAKALRYVHVSDAEPDSRPLILSEVWGSLPVCTVGDLRRARAALHAAGEAGRARSSVFTDEEAEDWLRNDAARRAAERPSPPQQEEEPRT